MYNCDIYIVKNTKKTIKRSTLKYWKKIKNLKPNIQLESIK